MSSRLVASTAALTAASTIITATRYSSGPPSSRAALRCLPAMSAALSYMASIFASSSFAISSLVRWAPRSDARAGLERPAQFPSVLAAPPPGSRAAKGRTLDHFLGGFDRKIQPSPAAATESDRTMSRVSYRCALRHGRMHRRQPLDEAAQRLDGAIMTEDEYIDCDAVGLAELVRNGAVAPAALVELALARIAAADPALGAIVALDADGARRAAAVVARDLPLAGVPFLVKDTNQDVAGFATRHGSRFYAEAAPAAAD